MLFDSIDFLFFIIIVLSVYYILPQKIKMAWLLLVSYVFYATWNVKYVLLMLSTTGITYLAGRFVEKIDEEEKKPNTLKKIITAITVVIAVFAIGFYKYANFAVGNFNKVLSMTGIDKRFEIMDIILPIGISFYVLQSLGYVIDVYRGKIKAERNILYYGLFVCFFPQITSGPIGRAGELIPQFKKQIEFDTDVIKDGMLTFAYGLVLKMVFADNINIYVTNAFDNAGSVVGMQLFLAAILFSIQIYCDFYGYSLLALGCGKMMQIELMNNFKQPYLQGNVRGLWRNWHISLTSWFTDYLYIPLGGNRKGKIRKYINTLIVFAVSGLWHGAAWHYVFWGVLNGFFIVLEDLGKKPTEAIVNKLKIASESIAWKITKTLWVIGAMSLGLVFFKAESLGEAVSILKSIVLGFRPGWLMTEACANSFDSSLNLLIIMLAVIVVFTVDCLQKTGRDVKAFIFRQQTVYRWMIYLFIIFVIVSWGAYGEQFEQTQFIYFKF